MWFWSPRCLSTHSDITHLFCFTSPFAPIQGCSISAYSCKQVGEALETDRSFQTSPFPTSRSWGLFVSLRDTVVAESCTVEGWTAVESLKPITVMVWSFPTLIMQPLSIVTFARPHCQVTIWPSWRLYSRLLQLGTLCLEPSGATWLSSLVALH